MALVALVAAVVGAFLPSRAHASRNDDLAAAFREFVARGAADSASALVLENLARAPDVASVMLREALRAEAAGDANAANAWIRDAHRLADAARPRRASALIDTILALNERWATSDRAEKVLAESLYASGFSAFLSSNLAAARRDFESALERYQRIGDRYREGYLEMNLGLIDLASDDRTRAAERLARASAAAARIGDARGESWATGHLATVRMDRGEYAAAESSFARALELATAAADGEREAEFRNNLGNVLLARGRFRDAGREYEQAIAIARARNLGAIEAAALHNLGIIQQMLGDMRAARATLESTLALAVAREDAALASHAESNLANVLFSLGEVARAESLHHAALARDIAAGDAKSIVADIENLARVLLARGDYSAAADTIDSAIRVCEAQGLRRERLYLLVTRGAILRDVNEFEEALRPLREAAAGAREIGDRAAEGLAETRLGELFARLGDFPEAGRRFETAARALEETEDALGRVAAKNQEAHALFLSGEIDAARAAADSAATLAARCGATEERARALWTSARVATVRGDAREAAALLTRAEAALPGGFYRDLSWQIDLARSEAFERSGDRERAAASLARGIETIEDVRGRVLGQRERARYVEDKESVYGAAVSILLGLERDSDAFLIAERARARAFLDAMAGDRGGAAGHDPARADAARAARQQVAALGAQWAAIEANGIEPAEEEAAGVIAASLREASADYERAALPALERDAAADARPASLDEVRGALRGGEAILDYFFARDGLVLFVVTPAETRVFATGASRDEIADRVRAARALLQDPASPRGDLDGVLALLGETLIGAALRADALHGAQRLYVVPHAELHHVPFAALVRPDGARLIDQFELVTLPSASLLALAGRREPALDATEPTSRGEMLVLGGATHAGRDALPFAEEEARRIAKGYDGLREVTALTGNAAIESTWKSRCARAGRIHIAAHGRQSRVSPLFAALELAPGNGDDGFLEAHEIMQLSMSADLAVLSGCGTALGGGFAAELPPGDEIVSLARAFLSAGARSVVATLWPIADRASADFMVEFHESLVGLRPAGALARTQRRWAREQSHRSHPFYWASAIVLGGGSIR
ncbi:MAG: CHAT domain-containing protein [bacterium]